MARGPSDVPKLEALLHRKILKYFPGYGNFEGEVSSVDKDRFVCEIVYEDGDNEEMYLDQVREFLLQEDSSKPIASATEETPDERKGYTWPPPSVTPRMALSEPRKRKMSEAALQRALLEESIKFERELRALELEQKQKDKEKAKQARMKAKEERIKRKGIQKAKKQHKRKKSDDIAPVVMVHSEQAHLPNGRTEREIKKAKLVGIRKSPLANGPVVANGSPRSDTEDVPMVSSGGVNDPTSPRQPSKRQTKAVAKANYSPPVASLGPVGPPPGDFESPTIMKRWSGSTTTKLVKKLKTSLAQNDTRSTTEIPWENAPHDECLCQEESVLDDVYRVINSKIDVTCGADGRYGITGNCTRGSLAKLIAVLVEKCELSEKSSFFDLGHGMGRPSLHIAAEYPHIRYSFGTEFNPIVYKQSMLILRELAEQVPCFAVKPRVFFMDANIKDLHTFNPFTHVYMFNIGMPQDLIDHTLELITLSKTVKYVVLFPHRTAPLKRLHDLGEVVETLGMQMPGGCTYEALVIKVVHDSIPKSNAAKGEIIVNVDPTAFIPTISPKDLAKSSCIGSNKLICTDDIDIDIQHALEVVNTPLLYHAYLQQLGTVSHLESEQQAIRNSRRNRRHVQNNHFGKSPLFGKIHVGLLRKVALRLGVSSVGAKAAILSNIQEYVPVPFSLRLFAVENKYDEEVVERIVKVLLQCTPSRRQPELTL